MNGDRQEIVAVDLGGTHVRFAIATIAGGRVIAIGDPQGLDTASYESFEDAWRAFAAKAGRPLPRAAAIAFAGPVEGETIKLTNLAWVITKAELPAAIGLDHLTIVNDFGAVAHAVAQLPPDCFEPICGPDVDLPAEGVISIIGPGTGLGVAQIVRHPDGYEAIETEGGHTDFAPLDDFEDTLLDRLRMRHRRVSTERVLSGNGLVSIYETLAALEGHDLPESIDTVDLWTRGLGGKDRLASAAIGRFCQSLGSVAGDIALAQGAKAVVIAGGNGVRLRERLPGSGFGHGFIAKGRFAHRMAALPVRLITYGQPGLYGAAAAGAAALARGASAR